MVNNTVYLLAIFFQKWYCVSKKFFCCFFFGLWELSSLTRNGTKAPSSGSVGSKLLDHQESHQLSQYHTARKCQRKALSRSVSLRSSP